MDNAQNEDSPSLKLSSYQVFVMVLLALTQFTVVLDFMIMSPLGDILMKSLNMNTGQFGAVVSAYAFSASISGFMAAGFADKYDRKKLLLFFYTGFILGTICCGFANSYFTLLAARIVTGLFGGVVGSIGMAIVSDLFALQQRGRVLGFIQMAFAVSQIAGIPLGLLIATKLNWNASFFFVVLIAVIALILVVTKLKPLTGHLSIQKQSNPFEHLFNCLKNKNYRVGFTAISLISMGGFMIMPFTSAFLVNNAGVLQEQLALVFLFTGLASIIIIPIVGGLSDRYDKFRLFTTGSLLAGVLIVIYTNMSITPLWLVIIINVILFMGIMSRITPAMALNSAIPRPSDRGAYMSITSSLQQLAGGVAAAFAGVIVNQKTQSAPLENFDMLGYIVLGSILLCIYLLRLVDLQVKTGKAGV